MVSMKTATDLCRRNVAPHLTPQLKYLTGSMNVLQQTEATDLPTLAVQYSLGSTGVHRHFSQANSARLQTKQWLQNVSFQHNREGERLSGAISVCTEGLLIHQAYWSFQEDTAFYPFQSSTGNGSHWCEWKKSIQSTQFQGGDQDSSWVIQYLTKCDTWSESLLRCWRIGSLGGGRT